MEADEENGDSLRRQLEEAIKECRRQIEILQWPERRGRYQAPENSREIALLENELQRLQEALRDLGGEDSVADK